LIVKLDQLRIARALLMSNLLSLWYLINKMEVMWDLSQAFTGACGFYFLDLAAHVTSRNLGDGIPSTDIISTTAMHIP
jgi:hypothetical protein